MNPPVEKDLFSFACHVAQEAAQLTLNWFQKVDLQIDIKADGTEVTDADLSAEEFIRTAIGKECPEDTVVGEEDSTTTGTSSRRWIIDPIDGTASFVRGVPLYSSLLAMFDEYGPAIGLIHLPALGQSLLAGRGLGAINNGKPARISSIKSIPESCISSSSFDQPWWPDKPLRSILNSGAKTRTWGDGYGYFLVGTGRIEAMIDPSLYTYDIAPMLTVIPECGGTITTWDGGEILEDKKGLVATNGQIHEELLTTLSS